MSDQRLKVTSKMPSQVERLRIDATSFGSFIRYFYWRLLELKESRSMTLAFFPYPSCISPHQGRHVRTSFPSNSLPWQFADYLGTIFIDPRKLNFLDTVPDRKALKSLSGLPPSGPHLRNQQNCVAKETLLLTFVTQTSGRKWTEIRMCMGLLRKV